MSPTPQTPPTDRPLTAGDVPLLREGDVLRVVVGPAQNQEWEDVKQPTLGEEVTFIKPSASGGVSNCIVTSFDPAFGFRPTRFTFVSRPGNQAIEALLSRLDNWGYAPGRANALEAAATIRKLMADAGRVL